jgi:GAF domain-containing protein
VLKLLASQAAISLEHTQLYRDLEDREGRIRRQDGSCRILWEDGERVFCRVTIRGMFTPSNQARE